jgi:ligand-binding SRPBCC domain-containing protein
MPTIKLTTTINANILEVFDNSRSIDLHQESTAQTNEKAIAGKTSGLIELGESVTWRAKHFGVYQTLTSKITEMVSPTFFVDEMTKGIFRKIKHEHHFEELNDVTSMTDIMYFESPGWIFGKLFNKLILTKYMTQLLLTRNNVIKQHSEKPS